MRTPRQPTIRTWFVFVFLIVGTLALTHTLNSKLYKPLNPAVFAIAAIQPVFLAALVAVICRKDSVAAITCFFLRNLWYWGGIALLEMLGPVHEMPDWMPFVVVPLWPEGIVITAALPSRHESLLEFWYVLLVIGIVTGGVYGLIADVLAKTCRLRYPRTD
jgi:hypothetical protein